MHASLHIAALRDVPICTYRFFSIFLHTRARNIILRSIFYPSITGVEKYFTSKSLYYSLFCVSVKYFLIFFLGMFAESE